MLWTQLLSAANMPRSAWKGRTGDFLLDGAPRPMRLAMIVAPTLFFDEAAYTVIYAWNSSTRDGTNIICSMRAIGRPFCFPFDLSLFSTPVPIQQQAINLHASLRLAAPTIQFAEQVLPRLLTEGHQAIHRKHAN